MMKRSAIIVPASDISLAQGLTDAISAGIRAKFEAAEAAVATIIVDGAVATRMTVPASPCP